MTARLKLNFFDVSFNRVSDEMVTRLEHTVLSQVYERREKIGPKGEQSFGKVITSHGARYKMWVDPKRYRSMFRIIRVLDAPAKNEEHIVLAVRPQDVINVVFPLYNGVSEKFMDVMSASNVESFPNLKGQELYDALELDPIKKAGLLNLHAKMNKTLFQNGKSVLSYVNSLTRIRGDRIFARVEKELRDEVKNACIDKRFTTVSGSLHTPPPGFIHAGSFKSPEEHGNLQLTFFGKPSTLEFIIDADIDDANGIEHIFQVTEHALTGSETHPYDIHQILIHDQQIHPRYQLIV